MSVQRRIFDNPDNVRNAIHEEMTKAVRRKFPIVGRQYTADISNLRMKVETVSPERQKELLNAKSGANDALYADIAITENSTGKKVGELKNKRLMNIPYFTKRHTMMLDGNEYSIVSQMRTKPGVYTRKRGNDELESSFNLAKGANFKLIMDPDSGIFKIDILGSSLLAAAVLKILGATSKDLADACGAELADKNFAQLTDSQLDRARSTLFSKLVAYNSERSEQLSGPEKDSAIREYFSQTKMDPETTKLTLGNAYESVSAMTILDAVRKILAVYKNVDDVDERDQLEFQKVFCVEDLLAEVIDKAKDVTAKFKSKLDRWQPGDEKKDLKTVFGADVLSRPLRHFITTSSLSRLPSQINPMEFADAASIVTRLGEGAIGNERAVPFETRGVNYSYMGLIDPIAAPESFKVGIDVHATMGAVKGSDNEFRKAVYNCRTGKAELLRCIDLHDKYVGFPDPIYNKDKLKASDDVAAVYRGKLVHVKRSQLDYQIRNPHALSTFTTNTIPFMSANQGNRLLMGDKHVQQALPLKNAEARLVRSVTDSSGTSVTGEMAKMITPTSPVDGVVQKISSDTIYVRGNDGAVHEVGYETNTALATKTFVHDDVTVKVGDKVRAGQALAQSNYVRDGELTMGRNLVVAYMPYEGYNHEDGVVMSESTAKDMTSVHADKVVLRVNNTMSLGKSKYVAAFPTTFTQEQLAKLDDEGLAKKGVILEEGDPVILALENSSDSRVNQVLGLLHKSLVHQWRDCSEVYELHYPAEVVSVVSTPSVKTVVLKIEKPMQVGDKLAGSYGNKGVVSKIIPDDQMPHDESGKPVNVVFTSAGVISRINPAQILESALGKVAKKTGRHYNVENFSKPDYIKFVRDEMKKHGVKDKETITEPITGKKIPGVFVGVQHCHKLFKTTDTNYAARGIEGPSDQNEAPSGSGEVGPKALGSMEVNALLAHNARALLREGTVLRGAKNLEFWKTYQSGLNPRMPDEKKTFTRFLAILKQAGINVRREGTELVAAPLTDKDVLSMSSGEIKEGLRLNAKNLTPEIGGLFDPATTGGLQGTRWGHIRLVEPVVNPVFEDAAKSVLNLGTKEFQDMSVEKGGAAIRDALNAIDVAKELDSEEERIHSGKITRTDLDKSVKRVKYLRALKENGTKAGEAYVLSVVPVTPPVMRPIVVGKTGDTMDNDANTLYRDLILQNNSFRKIKEAKLGEDAIRDNRKALQTRMKELTGIVAPESPTLKARGVKGALAFIAGDVPKEGYFQDKVIYGKMNLSGRATISPDTTLGLDEVGLPEDMAWNMYKPFVVRRLSQSGYSPIMAKDAIENRHPSARRALEEELAARPVILNRAPTLWRHGIMSARPVLRDGKNLRVNSLWESGYNMDYDGDAMQVHLPVTDEAVQDAINMLPSKQIFSDKKKDDLIQAISREPIIGLYKATANVGKPKPAGAKVFRYANVDQAWKDYYAGKLKMTDYVEIGGR